MPSDSIITTTMTMHIVMIGIGWNSGTPKWNGNTIATQCAVATFSKCINPIAAASTAPATIPNSTATFARSLAPI